MQLMSTGSESVKAQVVDKIPKRIKELQFGIQYVLFPGHACIPSDWLTTQRSNQDIVNQAVLEVSDRVLYDVDKMRQPVPHGALDARLVGIPAARDQKGAVG
jgi:DNA-directed RNA polymerase III subunit RPC1